MNIRNNGELEFNKELTEEYEKKVREALEIEENIDELTVEEKSVIFDDYPTSELDGIISEMIDAVKDAGYIVNGTVRYYGDYYGKIYVEDNNVISLDESETGFYEATEEELISMLKKKRSDNGIRGKRMRFKTGQEMLDYIHTGNDLYCEETGLYLFEYNDRGAVCYYNVSNEKARDLQKLSEKYDGEYWGGFLGAGGSIMENDDGDYECLCGNEKDDKYFNDGKQFDSLIEHEYVGLEYKSGEEVLVDEIEGLLTALTDRYVILEGDRDVVYIKDKTTKKSYSVRISQETE